MTDQPQQRAGETARTTRPPSRIGVVVNPHAGKHAFDEARVAALRSRLARHDRVAISRSPEAVEAIARDFREQGVDTLGVVGGDSSASSVLTGFWKVFGTTLPRVALLGAGTMNTVARSLGVARRAPEILMARILDARRHGRPLGCVRRGTLCVRDRLGFIFGLGAFPGFLSEYYAWGRGHPTAVTASRVLARLVTSALLDGTELHRVVDPVEAVLKPDGEQWPSRRYMFVAAGTVASVGLGFHPFHHADACVDRFEILAAHGSARRILASFPRVQLGRPPAPGAARARLCRHLVVCTEAVSTRYSLDGDLFEGPGELRLEAGPVFDFLLP